MSLKDYSILLKESGGTGSSPTGDDSPLHIQHVLTIGFEEKLWDHAAVQSLVETTLSLARGVKVLLYAASAALVLYASAKLIEAARSPPLSSKNES